MADQADIDGLAGEYVLGALDPEERDATVARLRTDPRLAGAVAEWERLLAPLALREAEATPPATALSGALATIAQNATTQNKLPSVTILERSARRWRAVAAALAASLVAVAIGITVAGLWSRSQPGHLVAVLAGGEASAFADEALRAGAPVFVALLDEGGKRVSIRRIAGRQPGAGRVHAVWLETSGQRPALLGVFERGADAVVLDLGRPLPAPGTRLSVTSELTTAAPWSQPRGPVVSHGTLRP